MSDAHIHATRPVLQPIMWGVLFGALQAASPLAIPWLEPGIVQSVFIAFIAVEITAGLSFH